MRRASLGVALAAVLLAMGGAAQAAESLSAKWARLWTAKQLDAVMALYASHPVFLPTVGPSWEGRDEIRKNFAGILAAYDPHITLRSYDTERSGTLGYDSGQYEETITPMKGGKPIAAKGSYLFVFQRQKDGHWKILEQTWTSLTPPPSL